MNLGSESETVEFKRSTGEHREALQAICAMLNKHGYGELFFGVKDDGSVVGQDVGDATLRQVASWIADKIEPAVFPTIERLAADDDASYIRVTVSGKDVPYSAGGRYFTRVGTSNNLMTAAELSTMVIERERTRNPWDSIPSGRPVSDVDSESVRDFIKRGNEAGRISGEFSGAPDVLAKLGLIAADGSLTNAAVELFCEGSDVYPRMMLGLLGGNTKAKILDLHRETGTMLKLLDYAEYFVTSNIRREFVIGKNGMYRQEIPEIPTEAIREAVANALCHRDYTTGTPVQVNVYMDTVQIVSPGLFPAGDSPEKHLAGCADAFRLRNPKIAQALFRAGVIEQFGTGIPRIRTACEEAGVEFRFEQTDVSTMIVFERPGSMVAKRANNTVGGGAEGKPGTAASAQLDELSEYEQIAMNLARSEGRVTAHSLSKTGGFSRKTASIVLKALANKGLLTWLGKSQNDPHQFYKPIGRIRASSE